MRMDMVTLVQQQQQTLNGNHEEVQEEQNHVNGAVVPAQSHAVDRFRGEAGHSAKETAVAASSDNASVGDSSTLCSDVDDNDEEEETDIEEGGGWITNLPVSSTIVQQHQAFANTNGDVVLPNADRSNFGDVRVKNSTDVHLVNKTCYNGPVTIKQIVYTNPTSIQDTDKLDKLDASRVSDINISDLSASKDNGAPNKPIFPQNTKLNKVTQWLWKWKRAVLSCVLALILLAVVVFITVYFTHHSEIPDKGNTSVRFVERDEWGAQLPLTPLRKMKLPVPYVIICHTDTNFCTTQSECATEVRFIQDYHINKSGVGWSDIAYNFLVGGDGLAYVGRSWDYVGGHSESFNGKSIGIAFIGNFMSVVPPKTQLNAAQKIIELGVKDGKIASNYKLLGHRQVVKTKSPGDALYNEIKKWPHWSDIESF